MGKKHLGKDIKKFVAIKTGIMLAGEEVFVSALSGWGFYYFSNSLYDHTTAQKTGL